MANNFRLNIEGAKYFAKPGPGHDSNDGLTADTPKATVTGWGGAGAVIVGSGVFLPNVASSGVFRGTRFYADGVVKFIYSQLPIRKQEYHNMTIQGPVVMDFVEEYIRFFGCIVISVDNESNTDQTSSSTIYINSKVGGSNASILNGCIFTGKPVAGLTIINCYADADAIVSFGGTTPKSGSTFYFGYNNIQAVIVLDSRSYAIQDQFVGTPQVNGYAVGVKWLTEANLTADGYSGTISGWDAAVATCMNRDPMFNNPSIGDYSLQAGSPMVGAAENGIDNIGGTRTGITTLVNQNGVGNIEVIPSPEIDTTNPLGWVLNEGETEGYIDFIEKIADTPEVLDDIIVPISDLLFDSDYEGGSSQNRNVIDSHPRSADYPEPLETTASGGNTTTLKCTGHGLPVGMWVRVLGEAREITAVPDADTITVGSAFRAIVASGVGFQAGTEAQLAALNPNRLTYEMRTSTQSEKPTTDAEWDNSLDPIYGQQGVLFTQEWYAKPELVIDAPNVYGGGDTDRPIGVSGSEISCTWRHIRVYLRNDYRS
ncbi:hypothetical protein [Roseivirga seohaensis]|uniref:hypothetical protein n=1 Tax=Roseivirga seohaensis TaxID=1914963 RepID=UPI003BA8C02E